MNHPTKSLERKLVLELTRFLDYDSELLNSLLSEPLDYPWVLGQLCWHRSAGIAYYVLKESGYSAKVNRDFRFSLQSIYEFGRQKNLSCRKVLAYLSELFVGADFAYAFLKGSFLSTEIFPEGLRTSNDFDLLVSPSDVSACENLLKKAGFIQGYYRPDQGIFPATRRQIVASRLNRGETVPFFKESDLDGLNIIEIDLNFSMDYKTGDDNLIAKILKNAVLFSPQKDCYLFTLSPVDFVIHLCTHLHKEASVYFWVEKNRDLSIYKFCDLYALLVKWGKKSFFHKLIEEIRRYEVQKECCYALTATLEFYPSLAKIDGFQDFLQKITPDDTSFIKEIINPQTGEVFTYEQPILDWLFRSDRLSYLNLKKRGDFI